MNQILTTKPVKPKKSTNIKTVKIFFAISIIIFGICLLAGGSYALYKSMSEKQSKDNTIYNNNAIVEEENAEIQIDLSQEGTNVLAKIKGEKEIEFVTYKWDDEEENRENIGGVSGELSIEIPGGEHKLTVTAVDNKNNSATKVIKTVGVTRPKLEVKQEGSEFVINASDDIGLDKLEFILNGQGYLVRVEGAKEKQFRYPLVAGENTLEVTAYNTKGYTETFNALCRN